jgi:hypothetical protein
VKESPYFKQAELMLKTIPHVAAETCFGICGKSWKYVLIPHDAIAENMTLSGLVSQFG